MNLEPVIQSEVSQKEKNKYVNAYIWNLEKWYWGICLQGRNRDSNLENGPTTQQGQERVPQGRRECPWEELGSGMNWEISTEIRTLSYAKQRASGDVLEAVLCDNLEGWDAMGGGRGDQEGGDICIPMTDSYWCMGETKTTIVKQSQWK